MSDMTEIQIAWLELIIMGSSGIILALSGVIIAMLVKKQNQSCTEKTEGIVKKYGFPGDGKIYPVVEYYVNGSCYKTKKKFNGVISKRISGFPISMKAKAYEDEKGCLHVTLGSIANLRQLAEELWPIGSRMTVYYNPNNPKCSYADRPLTKNMVFSVFISAGVVMVLSGVLVFFLIQL